MRHNSAVQKGFSLIELMIVVVIVAILSAIALPSYFQYVKRSHRAEAKTALLNDAQFMERVFTESNAYNTDSGGTAVTTTSLPYQQTAGGGYDISLVVNATTFTLTATPVTGGPMDGDECGNLTINYLGVKSRTGAAPVEDCWNK